MRASWRSRRCGDVRRNCIAHRREVARACAERDSSSPDARSHPSRRSWGADANGAGYFEEGERGVVTALSFVPTRHEEGLVMEPFKSWKEVLDAAKSGDVLYYQAPLNHRPTQLRRLTEDDKWSTNVYEPKAKTVRIVPYGAR